MGATTHIIRRGLAVARDHYEAANANDEIKLSKPTLAVVTATLIFFSLWLFAIKYTYLDVIGTLSIVENPDANALVVSFADEDDGSKKPVDPEILVVKPQPITGKIRTAVMHLRAEAGYWSRFRGLSLFLIYFFCRGITVNVLMKFIPGASNMVRMGAEFIAEILLARFEMTWVHIVISKPSKLPWYKRIPRGWKPYKNIAPAAALQSAATHVAMTLPSLYVCHSKFGQYSHHPDGLTSADAQQYVLMAVAFSFIYGMTVILIQIPATVTFIRVAASMLPEEDESIVPFDRTFGGKVTPEIVGGAGKIGLLEAWRSFNRASRLRLLTLIAKVLLIQSSVAILSIFVVIGELKIMMGKDFDRAILKLNTVKP